MRTKIQTRYVKTMEDCIGVVKAFFDDFCINPKEKRVVIAIEEDNFACYQIQVGEGGTLWKIGINHTDADDQAPQYEQEVLSVDTETMNRNFYGKDDLTVREWYEKFKLEDTIIPQYYHPHT